MLNQLIGQSFIKYTTAHHHCVLSIVRHFRIVIEQVFKILFFFISVGIHSCVPSVFLSSKCYKLKIEKVLQKKSTILEWLVAKLEYFIKFSNLNFVEMCALQFYFVRQRKLCFFIFINLSHFRDFPEIYWIFSTFSHFS